MPGKKEKMMNHKSFVRPFLFVLLALMLVVNSTAAAASPGELSKGTGKVFTVYPSGADDTVNLQQAFNWAKAAGPGSTVQLAPGNFHIGFVEVRDFEGYFKGAGQNKTFIDTFQNQNCQMLIDQNKWPALVYFMRGYPRISDLSFHITPSAPCLPYWGPDPNWRGTTVFPLVIASSPWTMDDCATIQPAEKVSALVERVTIAGEDGIGNTDETFLKSNIYEGLFLGGMMSLHNYWDNCHYLTKYAQGQFQVVQSTFRHAFIGLMATYLYNSPLLIGGSPKDGNTFDENVYAVGQNDSSGSNFKIAYNRMAHIYGSAVLLTQGRMSQMPFIQSASNFAYLHNDITVQHNGTGFILHDYDNLPGEPYPSTGSRAQVVVQNNKVNVQTDSVWGIWMEGLDNPLILNNKIEGSSDKAIIAGSWGPTRSGLIKGNNLNGFTPSGGDPYKILLDWGTQNYTVAGESGDSILDKGTNNWIVGSGLHSHRELGQALRDALKHKMEIFKNLVRGMRSPAP
jgi:hypothetical protein